MNEARVRRVWGRSIISQKMSKYQRLALGQEEYECSKEKGMGIRLPERSFILTLIYKKRSITEETILNTGIIRVYHNSQGLI